MQDDHVAHANNMCALTCCHCNMDLEKVKTIVKDAKYVCRGCGHVAADQNRLCEPIALS